MTVVHVDGRLSKTGGRVVKNVTGYDLAKLYTGSLGSLAVIAEISFKLRPTFRKDGDGNCGVRHDWPKPAAVLAAVRKSALSRSRASWSGPKHAVWLRFGEHPQRVDWQIAQSASGGLEGFRG